MPPLVTSRPTRANKGKSGENIPLARRAKEHSQCDSRPLLDGQKGEVRSVRGVYTHADSLPGDGSQAYPTLHVGWF